MRGNKCRLGTGPNNLVIASTWRALPRSRQLWLGADARPFGLRLSNDGILVPVEVIPHEKSWANSPSPVSFSLQQRPSLQIVTDSDSQEQISHPAYETDAAKDVSKRPKFRPNLLFMNLPIPHIYGLEAGLKCCSLFLRGVRRLAYWIKLSGCLRGCGCQVGRWEGSIVSSTPTLQHHLVTVAILGRRDP